MAKVEIKVGEGKPEGKRRPMPEMVRRLMMAGIGAVALTQEEMEKTVDKLVEQGEIAWKDRQKFMQEMMDRRREGAKKAQEEVEKRVEEAVGRMNVPTKADIDALSEKIAALTRKVDELKKG